MDNVSKHSSFWTTVPGILTGVAAVVTAFGALITALYQAGIIGGANQTEEIKNAPILETVKQPTTVKGEEQGFVIAGDWDVSVTPRNGSPYRSCVTVTQTENRFTAIVDYVDQNRPPGTIRGFLRASSIKVNYENPNDSGTGALKILSNGQMLDGTWMSAKSNYIGTWLWRKRGVPCP